MAEAVVVGVRVRPFNQREKDLNANVCIQMQGPTTVITNPKDPEIQTTFTFDESFWSHDGFVSDDAGYSRPAPGSRYADQEYVFNKFGKRVLDNAWQGFHCCLFAYGQTGSGKSYSMTGYGANKGIVPISCEEIFNRISKNDNPNKHFEVVVSVVEIYNECVQDLLVMPADRPKKGLEIRESKMLGIYVDGATKRAVNSYREIEKVVDMAVENRTVGATLMNATSSRAHTVNTIEFKQVEMVGGKETVKVSMINLVDLAGSEKAGQTGATGDRLKEGAAINKSLTALGNVIEKLAVASTNPKAAQKTVIPYRDSKLTRLLQNALGGSSKTIMICALSPASSNYEETLSTLRYADRAKKIKNNAFVNEDPQDKLIRELKEENEKLKAMAAGGGIDPAVMADKESEIEEAKKALEDMQRNWAEKLRESKQAEELTSHRKSLLHVGTQHDGISPFIGNINDDPLLTGKVRYGFPAGKELLIGKPGGIIEEDEDDDIVDDPDEEVDISVTGEGMFEQMCRVAHKEGKVCISSHGSAAHAVFINGKSLAEIHQTQLNTVGERPSGSKMRGSKNKTVWIELNHGDRVGMGRLLFIFCVPPIKIQEMSIDAVKFRTEHQSGILHEAGAKFHQYYCKQRMATGTIEEGEAKMVDTSDPVAVAAELSILHAQIERMETDSAELNKLRDENLKMTQEIIILRASIAKGLSETGIIDYHDETTGEKFPKEDPLQLSLDLAGDMLAKFVDTIEKVDHAKKSLDTAQDKVDSILSKPSSAVMSAFQRLGLM